jgi:hypothetical protein
MNGVDCKAVCREIDELDRDERPGVTILAHVKACAQCQAFYNERVRLREIVADLPAVSAPADFDFRLRAKLATAKSSPAASPRMFGFSIPSVALATIALLVVGGLSFRVLTGSGSESGVAVTETPRANEPTTTQTPLTSPESVRAVPPDIKLDDQTAETTAPTSKPNSGLKSNGAFAKAENRRRGSGRYPVQQLVRRENPLAGTETASMFPLEASEPLRVSVDYAAGGSRTISVPTLSFGSQEVVSRGGSPMMKTSARTVW